MPEKIKHSIYHCSKNIHPFSSLRYLILIQIILFILILNGCTFFSPRQESRLFLTEDDVENIIQNIKKQNDIVSGFYSTGTLTINGWILDTSVDIFIAANRDPLMFKMEISHSWGTPLLYILIKEDRLVIRDFREKKQYTGRFSPGSLSIFLPDMDWSPDMIWSFLRGYPGFISYDHAYEGKPGVVNIEDRKNNRLGTITFSPGEGIIEAAESPPRSFNMKFNDFLKTGDIDYAVKTVVKDVRGKKDLIIKRKKVVFNKDIPDAIFTLKNKPSFEEVGFDEM